MNDHQRTTRMSQDIIGARSFLRKQLTTLSERPAPPLPCIVPAYPADPREQKALRLMLIALDVAKSPLVFDLYADSVIGHSSEGVHIDLAHWAAKQAGVSRQHALLHPRPDRLYIIDKNSTNGTAKNGLPLSPNRAYELRTNDILTLGGLHIGIKVEGDF
jgi:hypothetical protein